MFVQESLSDLLKKRSNSIFLPSVNISFIEFSVSKESSRRIFFFFSYFHLFHHFEIFFLMGKFFQKWRIFVGSAFFKKQQKIKWSSSRQTFFLLKMPFCGFVCWHKFRWFANIIFFTTSYFIAVATFKVLRFWNKV